MKKYGLIIISAIAICCIVSCEKESENSQEQWMIANKEALNTIKANPAYKELRSPGNESSIYYKALQSGDGTGSIYYTSSVSCYYKGCYIADYLQYNIKAGDKFDQRLFDDGPPAVFSIDGSIIPGWKTALQHMVKGDKWEIWIPYQLGYGSIDYQPSSSSPKIPGYSTLVFELEVVNVYGIDEVK